VSLRFLTQFLTPFLLPPRFAESLGRMVQVAQDLMGMIKGTGRQVHLIYESFPVYAWRRANGDSTRQLPGPTPPDGSLTFTCLINSKSAAVYADCTGGVDWHLDRLELCNDAPLLAMSCEAASD
jgi:hypothetical protein